MGLSRENLIHSIFTARPKAVNARIYKIKTSTRKCRRLRFDAMSHGRGQLPAMSLGERLDIPATEPELLVRKGRTGPFAVP